MSVFEVTILGSSSATPTSKRNPTAQVINVSDRVFLIDCGEATQIQLRRFKVKFQRISHIFISHLHGDHYLGLMGYLSSLHLLGRTAPMQIFCPPGLDEIINIQLKHSATILNYPIEYIFHDFNSRQTILEDERIKVESIPLNHRIPCCGFIFTEKPRPRNLIREMLGVYRIPVAAIPGIKAGGDYITPEGERIPNEKLTTGDQIIRTYAYCSDTCYDERLIDLVKGADLLYHEATFMEERAERAKETFHSTTKQAATIALKAGVSRLVIGHYSARYKDLQPMLEEARSVFPQTSLAIEGEVFSI